MWHTFYRPDDTEGNLKQLSPPNKWHVLIISSPATLTALLDSEASFQSMIGGVQTALKRGPKSWSLRLKGPGRGRGRLLGEGQQATFSSPPVWVSAASSPSGVRGKAMENVVLVHFGAWKSSNLNITQWSSVFSSWSCAKYHFTIVGGPYTPPYAVPLFGA